MNGPNGFMPQITDPSGHFVRRRVNELLAKAIEKPLVIVCAGAGCGKTRAVYDFTRDSGIPTSWIQLSEHDNIQSRFWNSFILGSEPLIDESMTEGLKSLGFPDTED